MRVQSRKGDVRMKNYIFDLYGTLIDIHTNESKAIPVEKYGIALITDGSFLRSGHP